MKSKYVLAVLLALGSVSLALPAQNKNTEDANTRTVQGTVNDSGGQAVPGAVVQLKDTKTLQIRSFITQADGAYHFSGLSTNVEYQLKADHDGASSGSKTLSVYDGRKVAVINLKLSK
ncbi:MAG: carboxypeptidase-like regulatory domain-containing protein [Acidobacteriota bacterium]|jgi:hypothetical protein|nr:carboxypeptidase-like regulatory domain-containing protein [Acidobacteriota bacterium]